MFDAEPARPEVGDDELFLEQRLGALEPVAPQRAGGEVFESPMLGRMEFARMPRGRPSFWRAEQHMPDSPFSLQVLCEVEGDELPGADQVACVVAFRRLQVQDAMLCAPLINARLREMVPVRTVSVDDLVLTSIHLPPRPLTEARFELGFRATSARHLRFTVVFARGIPRSVRIDSDA